MKVENKNVLEGLSEALKLEGIAIAKAYGKLDRRAITFRVKVEREGLHSRQLALALGWAVSLVNSTDARTLCAVKGLENLTAAQAAAVVKQLGGSKASREKSETDFSIALQKVEAAKAADKPAAGDKTAAGNGLTPDERVLACITANRAEMTAAGKAAAIAALS